MSSSLTAKRAEFLQRQEKVQARNISDAAARNKVARKEKIIDEKPPLPKPSEMKNWLNNKDTLQAILDVQKLPLGAKLKKVIAFLREKRTAYTATEIEAATFVDVSTNKEVQENLRSNVKINFEADRYSYQATHNVSNKEELLRRIRTFKDGISFAELEDGYPDVRVHVQELRKNGDIWMLQSTDQQREILYPNDPKVKIGVDEDIKALVRGIEIPLDMGSIEKELLKAGIIPTTSMAQKIIMGASLSQQLDRPKAKKPRINARTKLTNSHLPNLFDLPPLAKPL